MRINTVEPACFKSVNKGERQVKLICTRAIALLLGMLLIIACNPNAEQSGVPSPGITIASSSVRQSSFQLSHYPDSETTKLGVRVLTGNGETRETWLIGFKNGQPDYRLALSLSEPQRLWLIDCQSLNMLCILQGAGRDQTFSLHRWQLTSTALERITDTIHNVTPGYVFASTAANVLTVQKDDFENTHSIYSQAHDGSSVTTLVEHLEDGCRAGPSLSPSGEYLALLCSGTDWLEEPRHPFAPTGQYLYLVKTDGSEQHALTTPATYYFDDLRFDYNVSLPTPPRPPEFVWSPDGTEIAYEASFAPPREYAADETPDPNTTTPYKFSGGIYSVSIADNTIHEWIKIGGVYPPLTWSPDKRYIAYALSERALSWKTSVYIVSRDGQQQQVGSIDAIQSLAWSPDGAYIAVRGIDRAKSDHPQVWVISLVDYTWHNLDFQGEVTDMQWITSAPTR